MSSACSTSASARSDYYSFYGETTAIGVDAINIFGDVLVTNEEGGSISADASTAYGSASATGISALAYYGLWGNATVDNAGSVSASAITEAACRKPFGARRSGRMSSSATTTPSPPRGPSSVLDPRYAVCGTQQP